MDLGPREQWVPIPDPLIPNLEEVEKIDSKFRLRYRIDFRQRSPFRRKSRAFQKSQNFSQILELRKSSEILEIRFSKG